MHEYKNYKEKEKVNYNLIILLTIQNVLVAYKLVEPCSYRMSVL